MVLATWRTYLEASYSDATVRHYWGSVMRFMTRHPLAVEHITEDHVVDFLQQFPFRSASRRAYYQGLKSYLDWCVRRGLIPSSPIAGLKVPVTEEKVTRALSEVEYAAVLTAAYARNPRRGATLELLYYTAARVGEIITLRWDDVSSERVVLHGHKTGKERVVDMTPGLHAALGELFVYFGTYERVVPRSGATIWDWCRTAGREAGIEGVHPHLFRSTAATRMLVKGARPHAVQDVLGHGSIKTTQRYWAITEEDRKQALGLL